MLPTPEINFKRTPVTLVIMALAVALEVVFTFDEPRRVYYYNQWLGILPRMWTGELWRPFTSTLMHGGFIHAAFNVYWLAIFGPALENRFGWYRTLGLIVLLGYVSMMCEYVVGSFNRDEPVMIVGLSGIVYGLFGILWVGRRWCREFHAVCDNRTGQIFFGWFVLCILFTHFGLMSVANIAHGAGVAFGALYGLVIFDVRRRLRWAVPAAVITVLVLSTLIACPGHAQYERARQLQRQLEDFQQRPAFRRQNDE